jgi:carnitine 3-dehydrogenase
MDEHATGRPRAVALLGGGVIGGGWAARFVLNGVDVRLHDPDPDAARKVDATVDNARRAYRKLTLAPLPAEGALTVVTSVEEAVAGVDFVQESAPEREDVKRALLATACRAAEPHVVIGSSTSGLLPSRLQADMEHAERLAVGHPFNPVYLLPLVEVCGGERTSPATLQRAAAVYRSVGMWPLVLRKEVDGFVADRLLEALWREALWLVRDDVATVQEIDDAIRYGAGLRWSFMGTFLTYRIAGGEAGMRHFMAQFGPALRLPWTKLMDVPELDEALIDKIVTQSDEQAGGRSIRQLEELRDDCLVAVIQGLRTSGRSWRRATPWSWATATTSPGPCAYTPRACCPSGSTTTATRTRADTCRCSATPPTPSSAMSGSTPRISPRAAATTQWRPTCRTCARRRRGSSCM